MTDPDRAAALAWAAGQLSWERRLRELETARAAEEPPAGEASDPVSEPARAPGRRRRAGSHAPAH